MATQGPIIARQPGHDDSQPQAPSPEFRLDDSDQIDLVDSAEPDAPDDLKAASNLGFDPGDRDLIRVYLKEIGRTPLLTRADEVRLGTAYREGRRLVQEALCKASATVDEVLYLGAHLRDQAASVLPLLHAVRDDAEADGNGSAPAVVPVERILRTLAREQTAIQRDRQRLDEGSMPEGSRARRATIGRIAAARARQTRALKRLRLAHQIVDRVVRRMRRQSTIAATAEREIQDLARQGRLSAAALARIVPNGNGYHPTQVHQAFTDALARRRAPAPIRERLLRLTDLAWSALRPGDTGPAEIQEILANIDRGTRDAEGAKTGCSRRTSAWWYRTPRGTADEGSTFWT